MSRTVSGAGYGALVFALMMAGCAPKPPAQAPDKAVQTETSSAEAAVASGAMRPACEAVAAQWSPTGRYAGMTDCRINPKGEGAESDRQIHVTFLPTQEKMEAAGVIRFDVVDASGAELQSFTEAYVFQYMYPEMKDIDGDGHRDLLAARDRQEGVGVTRHVWLYDAGSGQYRPDKAVVTAE